MKHVFFLNTYNCLCNESTSEISLEKCRFRLAVYILIFGSRLVNSNYLTNSLIGNK